MKLILKIAVTLIGIMLVLMLIEIATGIHIGLADVFTRFMDELKDLFNLLN